MAPYAQVWQAGPAGEPADERREILETARQASTMPWDDRKVGFYQTVVPQMVRWLPDDEAERIKRAFETELARLSGPASRP